ncbi:hypothetical protein DIPPA_11719 [Diplonema papillatum]|nr:hypothetical protein DIPPA_11719 [Diplonema papillatum]
MSGRWSQACVALLMAHQAAAGDPSCRQPGCCLNELAQPRSWNAVTGCTAAAPACGAVPPGGACEDYSYCEAAGGGRHCVDRQAPQPRVPSRDGCAAATELGACVQFGCEWAESGLCLEPAVPCDTVFSAKSCSSAARRCVYEHGACREACTLSSTAAECTQLGCSWSDSWGLPRCRHGTEESCESHPTRALCESSARPCVFDAAARVCRRYDENECGSAIDPSPCIEMQTCGWDQGTVFVLGAPGRFFFSTNNLVGCPSMYCAG